MNEKNNKELLQDHVSIWNQASKAALADGQIDSEEIKQLKTSLGRLPFASKAKNKKEMTESHLNMWRLVTLAIHADGHTDQEEIAMIEKYIEELNFNSEQKDIIKKELKTPSSLEDILPKITEPGDRSQSLYFVRLLLWRDKILTEEEEVFLKKVQTHFMQFSDIKAISNQLDQLKEKKAKTKDLLYSLKNSSVVQFLKKIPFLSN